MVTEIKGENSLKKRLKEKAKVLEESDWKKKES